MSKAGVFPSKGQLVILLTKSAYILSTRDAIFKQQMQIYIVVETIRTENCKCPDYGSFLMIYDYQILQTPSNCIIKITLCTSNTGFIALIIIKEGRDSCSDVEN